MNKVRIHTMIMYADVKPSGSVCVFLFEQGREILRREKRVSL
jgi:hypothetical protein